MASLVDSKPQKFEVWLFATDIVNFVFLNSSRLQPEVVIGHFPGFICKDFSDTLKRAVQIIRDAVKKDVDEDFAEFQQKGDLNPDEYTKYAKDLGKANSCGGFEAENFLYYCVNLALMAYRFYHGGVRKAQISAVFCVAEGLQEHGSNYHLWEALNEIAEKIVDEVSGGSNVLTKRPLLRRISMKDNDDFSSPEFCFKDREISFGPRAHTNPVKFKVTEASSKPCSSADLPKSRPFNRGILANSCRRIDYRVKYYRSKEHDTMSPLHESLELNLKQISRTSALSFLKNEHASNSTPAEPSVRWKLKNSNRTSYGNSFLKQIFKLSPINKIKAESLGFH